MFTDKELEIVYVTKKILEFWEADPEFRNSLDNGTFDLSKYNFEIDPRDISFLLEQNKSNPLQASDISSAGIYKEPPNSDEPTKLFAKLMRFRHEMREIVEIESTPNNLHFKNWRKGQINRLKTSFSPEQQSRTPHINFAIELSDGCSVGCWFCGISAPKLNGHFLYTYENSKLWSIILESLKEVCGGSAAGWGILYWASDPFDNPDYEKFSCDFKDVFGRHPITTTAKGLQNIERTKNYFELTKEGYRTKMRLSILNKKHLELCYKEFSKDFLITSDIIPMNKGSFLKKRSSGRAFIASQKISAQHNEDIFKGIYSQSIACVSGFIINLPRKRIQLISPCSASESNPLGYYIYDESFFTSGVDFNSKLNEMIDSNMNWNNTLQKIGKFRSDMKLSVLPDNKLIFKGEFGSQIYHTNSFFISFAKEIAQNRKFSYKELIDKFHNKYYFIDREIVEFWLSGFYLDGILENYTYINS